MRQREGISVLELAQQEPRLKPGGRREGWCLDLELEPDERLVPVGHGVENMSGLTYAQGAI
jgi:hypothetical protein